MAEGTKAIINLGLEEVPVPGESGFPFPGLFGLPKAREEAGNNIKEFSALFSYKATLKSYDRCKVTISLIWVTGQ